MISGSYRREAQKENPHKADVKRLYNDVSAQVMHITLQPGETLKAHKTPVVVTFYILEGKPAIHIGDEAEQFENDTLIESPADIVHFISNKNQQQARILVTKAPRDKQTKLL